MDPSVRIFTEKLLRDPFKLTTWLDELPTDRSCSDFEGGFASYRCKYCEEYITSPIYPCYAYEKLTINIANDEILPFEST
jgi:hypothetical protein